MLEGVPVNNQTKPPHMNGTCAMPPPAALRPSPSALRPPPSALRPPPSALRPPCHPGRPGHMYAYPRGLPLCLRPLQPSVRAPTPQHPKHPPTCQGGEVAWQVLITMATYSTSCRWARAA